MDFREPATATTGYSSVPVGDIARARVGERESPLRQIWLVFNRHKLIIGAAVALVLLCALIFTLVQTPYYTADSTIEIQRESRNFANIEGAESVRDSAAVDQEFYETQYGLLTARSLAERIATKLRLGDRASFFRMFDTTSANKWFQGDRVIPGLSLSSERIHAAGKILLDHMGINPDRSSRLVHLRFSSPDPALSKQVVDAWATNFIQANVDRQYETTSYARNFLEQRLTQLRTRIDETERQLVDYAARAGIINLPLPTDSANGTGATRDTPLIASDLATFNAELAKATADRIIAESRLGAGQSTQPESLQNSGINQLRARRAELAADYAKLTEQFEPGYPPAAALKSQIAELDRSIGSEESRVGGSLQSSYKAAMDRERELSQRVSSLKTGLLDERRRGIQHDILQREVDTNRQLYAAILQRYKEIGVAGSIGSNNVAVIDPAELPKAPSSPRLLLNLLVGGVLGLLAGMAAALVREQFDTAISNPGDVAQLLGIPLLGTTPKVAGENPIEAMADPKGALSEAYLSLQTQLRFSTDHGFPKTLMVTSSRPAEGKSTTSYALARTLAQLGRNVILVDADMRSPSVHHLTGISNTSGLSNYLSGDDDLEALMRPGHLPNFALMTAGPIPPRAAELLASDRLSTLVTTLLGSFDNVVFDAPPVMGLADAPLLAERVEGVVFVIEAHGTSKAAARLAIDRLNGVRATILGAVVAKFDAKRTGYGYGTEYGYEYGGKDV